MAKLLEPIAINKASLITGVAEGYYKGVKERNPKLAGVCIFGAMPYGGEIMDHQGVKLLEREPYLFNNKNGRINLIYAGAMLPKGFLPLEAIFASIKENINLFHNVNFHFIGTGKTPDDPNGNNVKPLAEKYGLWNSVVFEYPKRIPYLDVLIHLEASDGVFIVGSTEPHYTPSKVYQGVLSRKPIFAILHKDSTAVNVIEDSNAGIVLSFDGENGISTIKNTFIEKISEYLIFLRSFDPAKVHMNKFDQYSANAVTRELAKLLDVATSKFNINVSNLNVKQRHSIHTGS